MNSKIQIISIIVTLLIFGIVVAEDSTPSSRCYQFTWLGPRYTNTSVFLNATCQEATRLSRGVPCVHPLVVSYDGSWPSVEYIWTHHAQQASCVLAPNDVCAQFTYYFDNHVLNSTYMCTRGMDTEGVAIRNGCFEQRNGSSATRVCFCRTVPGGVPCNNAISNSMSLIFYFWIFITLVINTCFQTTWQNIL